MEGERGTCGRADRLLAGSPLVAGWEHLPIGRVGSGKCQDHRSALFGLGRGRASDAGLIMGAARGPRRGGGGEGGGPAAGVAPSRHPVVGGEWVIPPEQRLTHVHIFGGMKQMRTLYVH